MGIVEKLFLPGSDNQYKHFVLCLCDACIRNKDWIVHDLQFNFILSMLYQ